ncbi:MAG: hypothetical protein IJR72_03775 [Oscillospiraceae bacterium]|nr:hypothetical protein [Oscillospiraceae bacterium]
MATVTDKLGAALIHVLEDYYGDVAQNVRQVVVGVTAEATKRLRDTAPKNTGEYAKNWKSEIERNAPTYVETKIYADKKPGLAHLLEDGRKAGEKNGYHYPAAPAKPHIRAVEEWAANEVEERLAEKWI